MRLWQIFSMTKWRARRLSYVLWQQRETCSRIWQSAMAILYAPAAAAWNRFRTLLRSLWLTMLLPAGFRILHNGTYRHRISWGSKKHKPTDNWKSVGLIFLCQGCHIFNSAMVSRWFLWTVRMQGNVFAGEKNICLIVDKWAKIRYNRFVKYDR